MTGRSTLALLMMALAIPLAGCGEKAQTAGQGSTKKSDAKAWEGTQGGAYAASGWKAISTSVGSSAPGQGMVIRLTPQKARLAMTISSVATQSRNSVAIWVATTISSAGTV